MSIILALSTFLSGFGLCRFLQKDDDGDRNGKVKKFSLLMFLLTILQRVVREGVKVLNFFLWHMDLKTDFLTIFW